MDSDDLDSFVIALQAVERKAIAVIDAVSVDVPITVPDRDYAGMTPKDCYEAGLMDGGMAVRKAIHVAIDAALTANDEIKRARAALEQNDGA